MFCEAGNSHIGGYVPAKYRALSCTSSAYRVRRCGDQESGKIFSTAIGQVVAEIHPAERGHVPMSQFFRRRRGGCVGEARAAARRKARMQIATAISRLAYAFQPLPPT